MPSKIKLLPKSQRPREKLIQLGPQSLSHQELLAIVLGSGNQKQGVLALAQTILRQLGTKCLTSVSFASLKKIGGLGPAKACTILSTIELGRRLFETETKSSLRIGALSDVLDLVSDLKIKKKESLVALFLNSRQELIAKEEIVVGGLNSTLLSPADLFRPALNHNASQLIIAHNHPSGDSDPSTDDLKMTARLSQVGTMLGIKLIDHVVITTKGSCSIRESHPKIFS